MSLASLSTVSLMRPWWLLALLPLGLLLWRLWRAPGRGAAAWKPLIDAHLLPHLLVFSSGRARRTGVALFAGALLAAVIALAGPALEQPAAQLEPAYRRDVARVLVLDLSQGMTARLEQVKLKLLALLQALPDGETALLVYGEEPYLVVPLTTDVATIALFVPDLAADAIPLPGNRPERALRMAGHILARGAARQREVLWITAGAGAAPLADLAGELAGARLSILAAADDPALAGAARRSGGAFARLRADDGDVRQLAATLEARASWTAGTRTASRGTLEIGYWLLLPLLPLAALAFRGGILMLLPPLLLAGLLAPQPAAAFPLAAMLADYRAWHLFDGGDAEAAAARFADPRWRAAANYRAGHFDQAASLLAGGRDHDSHYNRGNALARHGQLAAALAAYDAALKLRAGVAGSADTRHNRDLVRRLLDQPPPKQGENPPRQPPPKDQGGNPPRQPGGGQRAGASGAAPPPAPGPAQSQGQSQSQSGDAGRDADRVAEQWLRGIPDQPGTLLRRKLLAEQKRRQAGAAARAW